MVICSWIRGIKKVCVSFLQGQWLSQDTFNVIFWRTDCHCKYGSVITVGWIVVGGGGCSCSIITTTRIDSKTKNNGEYNENISQRNSCKWFRRDLILTSKGLWCKNRGSLRNYSLVILEVLETIFCWGWGFRYCRINILNERLNRMKYSYNIVHYFHITIHD